MLAARWRLKWHQNTILHYTITITMTITTTTLHYTRLYYDILLLYCYQNTPGLHYKIPVFSDPDTGKSQPLPTKKTYLSKPAPGENLVSGNLVMETGCMHIEIQHRVKKTSTINSFGLETLELKIRRLKLWKPTVYIRSVQRSSRDQKVVFLSYFYIAIHCRIIFQVSYIYIYIYIYIYTYTYIHIIYIYIYMCIYIYMYMRRRVAAEAAPGRRDPRTISSSLLLLLLLLLSLCIYIYIHTHIYIYIYIYIQRERDRQIDRYTHIIIIIINIIYIINHQYYLYYYD